MGKVFNFSTVENNDIGIKFPSLKMVSLCAHEFFFILNVLAVLLFGFRQVLSLTVLAIVSPYRGV
jgi:hypothetical protein